MREFRSFDRRSGETTSDFHNDFNPTLDLRGKVMKFKLLQITNATFNVKSDWILDLATGPVPLIGGLYSILTVAAMLQTQINNTMGVGFVTVVSDQPSATVKFTFAAPENILFASGPNRKASNLIWKLLGYTSNDGMSSVDSGVGLITSSKRPCAFGVPVSYYITIELDGVPQYMIDCGTNQQKSTLIVPVVTALGTMIKMLESDINLVILPENPLVHTVRFTVRDDYGNVIDMNNADWWITFELVKKREARD